MLTPVGKIHEDKLKTACFDGACWQLGLGGVRGALATQSDRYDRDRSTETKACFASDNTAGCLC